MKVLNSQMEVKKVSIVAYPADWQKSDIHIKLPAILECLFVKANIEEIKNGLYTQQQGKFTTDQYEIIEQEDNSLLITCKCLMLSSYICAYLNLNEIDFKFTQFYQHHTVAVSIGDNEEKIKLLFHFEENHLSAEITKEIACEVSKSPIDKDILNFVLQTINSNIQSLKEIDFEILEEEDPTLFLPW